MCNARNTESQLDVRAHFLSIDIILGALADASLPDMVKAEFLHVLDHVYLESDPLVSLVELHSRSWIELTDSQTLVEARTEISKLMSCPRDLQTSYLKLLVEWIHDYLTDHLKEHTLLQLTAEKAHIRALNRGRMKTTEIAYHGKAMRLEDGRNTLASRLLEVIHQMVLLGFYHDEEHGKDQRFFLQRVLLQLLCDTTEKDGHSGSSSHKV